MKLREELMAGKGGSRKWRFSIKVDDPRLASSPPIGAWLEQQVRKNVKLAQDPSIMKKKGDFIPFTGNEVQILCNGVEATFMINSKMVQYQGKLFPPLRFESHVGKAKSRNWKRSFIVAETREQLGPYLEKRGIFFGRTKQLEVASVQLRAELNDGTGAGMIPVEPGAQGCT